MTLLLAAAALAPGLVLGSFLNVVAARVPLRRSLVAPRSACMACGEAIAWYDNVPLVSYAFLRGRCRSCQTSIALRYPAVELSVIMADPVDSVVLIETLILRRHHGLGQLGRDLPRSQHRGAVLLGQGGDAELDVVDRGRDEPGGDAGEQSGADEDGRKPTEAGPHLVRKRSRTPIGYAESGPLECEQ